MPRTILVILIVVIAAFVLIGGGAGLFLKLKADKTGMMSGEQKTQTSPATSVDQSIFSVQTATINGKINKVNGNMVTITSKSGKSADFMLSPNVNLNKFDASQKMTNSNKKEDIETDKEVIVSLNYESGNYIVTTITYAPPQPSRDIPVPPTGTNSAVIKTTPRPQPN